jgi:hypothetical protein
VNSPDRVARIAASVGLGILLFEALFRINLSKHAWLVVLQTGLSALLIACVWFAALHRRRASSAATIDKGEKTAPGESQAADSLIQRTSRYFVLATGALLALPNVLAIRPKIGRVSRALPLPAFVAMVRYSLGRIRGAEGLVFTPLSTMTFGRGNFLP